MMADVSELGRMVKAKYPGAYDDMGDAALGAQVKAKFPGSYDDFADTTAAPVALERRTTRTTMMGARPRASMENFGEASAAALPYAGGMAGGFLGAPAGPPGMVLGAALGGSGGEALRQLWEHAMGAVAPEAGVRGPMSSAEAMGRVSRSGIEQGAAEASGQLLAAGARAVAPGLMRYGLKSPPAKERIAANRGTTLADEPDYERIAKTALEERAPSLGRARKRLLESNLETERRVGASVARGEKFYITEAAQDMLAQAEKSLGRKLTAKERAEVVGRARDAAADILEDVRGFKPAHKQTGFTAAEGRQIKREAQARSAPDYQARASGRRRPPSRGEFENLARGNRRAVDRLADTATSDARTAELIALEDALQNRAAHHGPNMIQSLGMLGAGAGGAFGHGFEGAGLGAAGAYMLGHPTTARWGANALTSPGGQFLLQQAPRTGYAWLDQLLENNNR